MIARLWKRIRIRCVTFPSLISTRVPNMKTISSFWCVNSTHRAPVACRNSLLPIAVTQHTSTRLTILRVHSSGSAIKTPPRCRRSSACSSIIHPCDAATPWRKRQSLTWVVHPRCPIFRTWERAWNATPPSASTKGVTFRRRIMPLIILSRSEGNLFRRVWMIQLARSRERMVHGIQAARRRRHLTRRRALKIRFCCIQRRCSRSMRIFLTDRSSFRFTRRSRSKYSSQ